MQSPSEVVYEMGYGVDEFGDVLCGPFSGVRSEFSSSLIAPRHWQVTHKITPFTADIRLSPQPERVLGLFRLPVLKVCFSLNNDVDGTGREFFKRFHQYFHKGGG